MKEIQTVGQVIWLGLRRHVLRSHDDKARFTLLDIQVQVTLTSGDKTGTRILQTTVDWKNQVITDDWTQLYFET